MSTVTNPASPQRLPRWVRSLYEWAVFVLGGCLWIIIGSILSALAAGFYYITPRSIATVYGRRVAYGWFRLFLGSLRATRLLVFDLEALDSLAREPGMVIAPNHPTLLDAVLVVSRLPDVACIMKPEVLANPAVGGGARLLGYIRSDAPSRMIRSAVDEMRAGRHVLVFPEGTRTRGDGLNPLTGGFALMAKQAARPVQTVIIETNSSFLGKGWPLLRKPVMPVIFRVRLGKRFPAQADAKALVAEVEQYLRAELAAHSKR